MNNFLDTYKAILRGRNINTLSDEDLPTVISGSVVLLRRHSINNQLCCGSSENNLEVEEVDSFGFVTAVRCSQCNRMMKTTCHNNAKWTNEKIDDVEQLKPGDHICWHRPYAIWHHGIVTAVRPEIKVIHYADLKVDETAMPNVNCSSCCDNLYRVNYQDCYNADYTVLRARKLKEESRYNLLERNCEHFSRWCKTGSTSSSQVGIFWASLGKVALTIGLRVIALVILGLLAYSYEAVEGKVQNRKEIDHLEMSLTIVYVVIITVIFITYLVITAALQLHPVRMKSHDIENPCSCSDRYADCTDGSSCMRHLCCPFFCCYSLFCQAICSLYICKHCRRNPCTCCRRPCNLACGLFWRIVLRECLAAALLVCVVVFEHRITTLYGVAQKTARERTAIFILFSVVAYLVGYVVGAFLGRSVEACCECHKADQTDYILLPVLEHS